MTSGELAKACGVGTQTLRYYERRGLLRDPRPQRVGYRSYTAQDARRVRLIKQAQGVGFTLGEIERVLAAHPDERIACNQLRELAQSKIADLEQQVQQLEAYKAELAKLAGDCEFDPELECSLEEALDPAARECC